MAGPAFTFNAWTYLGDFWELTVRYFRNRESGFQSSHLGHDPTPSSSCPGPQVKAETSRVKATGAWIYDGRVCNILAVSRAFGDWEFKGDGLKQLLQGGVQKE